MCSGGQGLTKLVVGKDSGVVLASVQANVTCDNENRIAEIKFPRPAKVSYNYLSGCVQLQ